MSQLPGIAQWATPPSRGTGCSPAVDLGPPCSPPRVGIPRRSGCGTGWGWPRAVLPAPATEFRLAADDGRGRPTRPQSPLALAAASPDSTSPTGRISSRPVRAIHGARLDEHGGADVVAAVDVIGQFVKQVSLVRNTRGTKVPEMVVGIADGQLRLQRWLRGQGEPVIAPERHDGTSLVVDSVAGMNGSAGNSFFERLRVVNAISPREPRCPPAARMVRSRPLAGLGPPYRPGRPWR
jgi:hypothetical protein